MNDFLGFGLLRPFRRDLRSDFAAAGGEEVIRSAVGQILGTVGASEVTDGDLPWRTEFGSVLTRLRHQKNNDILQELARVYVVDALQRWEPRIRVTEVRVTREARDGEHVLQIWLRYDVIASNVAGNQVLVAGIEQTFTL